MGGLSFLFSFHEPGCSLKYMISGWRLGGFVPFCLTLFPEKEFSS